MPENISIAGKLHCGRLGCSSLGSKMCAACNRVDYCSAECQKADWNIHKKYCSKRMNCRLDRFTNCPKQAAAISDRLDTAEEYLSRDPELSSRLRVSKRFMECLSNLLVFMEGVDSEEPITMRDLCARLKSILDKMGEVVESDHTISDRKDYIFSTAMTNMKVKYYTHTTSTYCSSRQERFDNLYEAIRISKTFADPESKTSALFNTFYILAVEYMKTGDHEEALKAFEEAYLVRSEHSGPVHTDVQRITLQLCRLLADMGEYDRMLEYLDVTLDNIRSHLVIDVALDDVNNLVDSEDAVRRCDTLHAATISFFRCAFRLPTDHVRRKDIFAQAFQMAEELLAIRIKFASTQPDATIHIYYNFLGGIANHNDIEFDYVKFLRLFQQLFDLYNSSSEHYKALLGVTKDILTILCDISVKLRKGIITTSSLNWDVLGPSLFGLQVFVNVNSHLEEAQVKRDLIAAEREGYLKRAYHLTFLLEKAKIKTYLSSPEIEGLFDILNSYHPYFVGERITEPDGNIRIKSRGFMIPPNSANDIRALLMLMGPS